MGGGVDGGGRMRRVLAREKCLFPIPLGDRFHLTHYPWLSTSHAPISCTIPPQLVHSTPCGHPPHFYHLHFELNLDYPLHILRLPCSTHSACMHPCLPPLKYPSSCHPHLPRPGHLSPTVARPPTCTTAIPPVLDPGSHRCARVRVLRCWR